MHQGCYRLKVWPPNKHDDHDNGTDDGVPPPSMKENTLMTLVVQGKGSWVGKNIAQVTGDVIKENRPDTKVRPWGGPGLFA
jgi:hypothetical protein